MAVILPFRQLYSKDSADDLFNRCCKIHARHCCPHHAANEWVETYRRAFNAFLDSEESFPVIKTGLPARRYLDAFAYGANLVHATSRKDDPGADLQRL